MPKKKAKFAVIGAGSAGLATAAHLAYLGYAVNLYNRTEERLKPLKAKGGFRASGLIKGFIKPDRITTAAEEAIKGVEIVIVATPAHSHRQIAAAIAPYLSDGQTVLLTPGRTGGAIEFDDVLKQSGARAKITLAETQTILYTCRPGEDSDAEILALKNKVALSAFPATGTTALVSSLKAVFPNYFAAADVLETGLNNVGCILHPIPTLLNIGWIESPTTRFKYYYEAITPSVAGILELLDEERLAVAGGLGIKAISTRQWLKEAYGANGRNLYEAIQNNKSYATIDAPESIRHRYLLEDVPTGLVPIAWLGKLAGVETPLMNHIIDLAGLACAIDFRKTGRTAQSLGISGYSIEQLRELVRHGRTTVKPK
jgi:opine dehydrogenase